MSKGIFLLTYGIVLVSHSFGAILNKSPVYSKNQRRIGYAFHNKNDFFDNFFNVNLKEHDKGADYMLTDNIYQKPNPFYTKKANDNGKTGLRDHLFPVYMPKHNESHHDSNSVQDISASQSVNNYEQPPTGYDEKTNTYNNYLPPSSSYGYGPVAPMINHGSSNEYGTSQVHSTYGPPSYSPSASYYPQSSYGPPAPTSASYPYPYYPTAPQHHEIDQKSHEGFFLKLIKKFDLVLLSKILLKLIIFKKIVKFIAVICLLLFLPALKKKFESIGGGYNNDDEDRKYRILDSYGRVDSKIKEIANFALTAIEGFESHQIPWCVGDSEFYCRVQYMLDQVDFRYTGNKILSLWFPALTTTTTASTPTKSSTSTTVRSIEKESSEVHFNDYITDSKEKTMSSMENEN